MKTCEFDHVKLLDYALGEGNEEAKREVEAHLQECSQCRTALSELKGARTILHKWQVPEASVRWIFAPQKVNRIRRMSDWLKFPSLMMPQWAMAAAVLIIVTLTTSALLRTNLQIDSQGVQLSFGNAEAPQKTENVVPVNAANPTVASNGSAMRPEEIILLVNTMLDSRDKRLSEEYRTLLAGVIKNVEVQRAEDIKRIINAMVQYEGRTNYWMKETSSVLSDIVQISQK